MVIGPSFVILSVLDKRNINFANTAGNFIKMFALGGITMEVKQIENFKIPNAVAHEITQEELQREYDFYMAQKMLETMFMFGMISVDEFHKISAVNRKTFSPFLSEIMG